MTAKGYTLPLNGDRLLSVNLWIVGMELVELPVYAYLNGYIDTNERVRAWVCRAKSDGLGMVTYPIDSSSPPILLSPCRPKANLLLNSKPNMREIKRIYEVAKSRGALEYIDDDSVKIVIYDYNKLHNISEDRNYWAVYTNDVPSVAEIVKTVFRENYTRK